jgi:hypothetical protein
VYYHSQPGRIVTDSIPRLIFSVDDMTLFLASHWQSRILTIPTQKALSNFLNSSAEKPKVILVVNATEHQLEFRKIASEFRHLATFGLIDARTFSALPFKSEFSPFYVLYRRGGAEPIIVNGIDLRTRLEACAHPTMASLTAKNYRKLCRNQCFARVSKGSNALSEKLDQSSLPTFWIPPNKVLGLKEGDWIVLNATNQTFARFTVKSDNEYDNLTKVVRGGLKGLTREKVVDVLFCQVGFLQSVRLGKKARLVWRLLRKADIIILDVIGAIAFLVYRLKRKPPEVVTISAQAPVKPVGPEAQVQPEAPALGPEGGQNAAETPVPADPPSGAAEAAPDRKPPGSPEGAPGRKSSDAKKHRSGKKRPG